MMKLLFATLMIFSFVSYASEDHHDGEHEEEGHEKNEAIELSPEATKNFGIKISKVHPSKDKAEIPISAIVNSEDKKQIFIFHEGKYEVREVDIIKKTATTVTVDNFKDSEDVVISGVNYLKVVEMSHGEEGTGGHGH